MELVIGTKKIGPGHKTLIIAEVAQAHDGSLGTAHAYIDAVADAGADAVKFQTHYASEESTLDEPFRVKFSYQDRTRYDYWKRMEFEEEHWAGLADHAGKRGLLFLSSPFSVKAVGVLSRIGMPAWKIGSGEVSSPDLLEAMSKNAAPILLSTGMSSYPEIENSIQEILKMGLNYAVFQCTSKYPTPLEEVGLNVLDVLRKRFKCPVGLSDHSGSPYPGLAAMGHRVDMLELHVTFDKKLFGPDMIASVNMEELRFLSEASEAFHTMHQNPVDKDLMADTLMATKSLFSKSLALRENLPAGTLLKREMFTLKKPGTGISPGEMDKLTGRRLLRDVESNRLLTWDDLE